MHGPDRVLGARVRVRAPDLLVLLLRELSFQRGGIGVYRGGRSRRDVVGRVFVPFGVGGRGRFLFRCGAVADACSLAPLTLVGWVCGSVGAVV